jgi:hypothetical protein
MTTSTLMVVIAILALGTYALRLGGVLLARRVQGPSSSEDQPSSGFTVDTPYRPSSPAQPPGITRLLPYAAVALLAALAATAAVTEAGQFAGIARPAGVLAGVVAGLLRAPFAVAVVIAAAVAAGLRLLGMD